MNIKVTNLLLKNSRRVQQARDILIQMAQNGNNYAEQALPIVNQLISKWKENAEVQNNESNK